MKIWQAWMKTWDSPLDRRFEADYEIHDPDGEKVDIYVGVNAPEGVTSP